MKANYFEIAGLVEIIPKIFEDDRGHFFESYHEKNFLDMGINCQFVQSNQSYSSKGVLRGLHFQKPPFAQAKLVKVMVGSVLDIAVDIRKNSPTYGKYCHCILDDKSHNLFFIPEGFAHGFLALEDCIFQYMCSNFYNNESEDGIIWNDPDLKIDWGKIINPLISEKDRKLQSFSTFSEQTV